MKFNCEWREIGVRASTRMSVGHRFSDLCHLALLDPVFNLRQSIRVHRPKSKNWALCGDSADSSGCGNRRKCLINKSWRRKGLALRAPSSVANFRAAFVSPSGYESLSQNSKEARTRLVLKVAAVTESERRPAVRPHARTARRLELYLPSRRTPGEPPRSRTAYRWLD